jgi:NDP-sugar pyrophosphorylase family protein
MAGRGKRFAEAGFDKPKPLIDIHGVPMFQLVLQNLLSEFVERVILISQSSFQIGLLVDQISKKQSIPFEIIEIDYITQGPADTVKLALDYLDDNLPVVTANSDQYIDVAIDQFYLRLVEGGTAGTILTMQDSDPKWSYVKVDDNSHVIEVREKQVISNQATVGVYGFSSATLLRKAFELMWQEEDQTNGEYYVAPSFNYLIKLGHQISVIDLGPVSNVMHGLGIPVDLNSFLGKPISLNAAKTAKELC